MRLPETLVSHTTHEICATEPQCSHGQSLAAWAANDDDHDSGLNTNDLRTDQAAWQLRSRSALRWLCAHRFLTQHLAMD